MASSRQGNFENIIFSVVNDIQEELHQNVQCIQALLDAENTGFVVHTYIISSTTNFEHVRIDGYTERWIPRYLDYDFFALYRMTKATFLILLHALNCSDKAYVGGCEPIPMEKALLMTLSWLGKGETLIRIHEMFDVAVSTVYIYTEFILDKILALKPKVICWPNTTEMIKIEQDFRNRSGFPGVIGAIDVCNIQFTPPAEHQESYIDKNRNHSIKLQAIVTTDKIFTNIMVGFPGSAHDSRVFRNSKFYLNAIENGQYRLYFGNNEYHLIGDKAYPLRTWLITPVKDNGRMTNQQRRYNTHHSRTRIVVEHTFGLLKSRWKILNKIYVKSVKKAVFVIAACSILHNFCFINYDMWEHYETIEHDDNDYENGNDAADDAVNKRARIIDLF